MTLLHFDGFRSYEGESDFNNSYSEKVGAQFIDWHSGRGDFLTSHSRFGSPDRGLELRATDYAQDNRFYYELKSTESPSTVIVGIVFYKNATTTPTVSTSYPLLTIYDNGSSGIKHINVCVNSTGNIQVYRNVTLLGTSSGAVIENYTWHCLEIKVYIHNSAGTVGIKLDGISILNLTSQDTLQGTNAYARKFRFHGIHNDIPTKFDCIWIMDNAGSAPQNDFLGDCRCDVIRPNGAGNQTDFAPSAGSNYQNVDDTYPDDGTTYNSDGTVNNQDSYALPSLTSGGTIFGVKPGIVIKKDDAGAKGAKILTRSNVTFYKSVEILPSTTYKRHSIIYQDNPDDSAAWAETDVNGMEVGVEVSS